MDADDCLPLQLNQTWSPFAKLRLSFCNQAVRHRTAEGKFSTLTTPKLQLTSLMPATLQCLWLAAFTLICREPSRYFLVKLGNRRKKTTFFNLELGISPWLIPCLMTLFFPFKYASIDDFKKTGSGDTSHYTRVNAVRCQCTTTDRCIGTSHFVRKLCQSFQLWCLAKPFNHCKSLAQMSKTCSLHQSFMVC